MKTINPEGIFNNYASEPATYLATYPSATEQQRYALQGAIAILLVTCTLLIAFAA